MIDQEKLMSDDKLVDTQTDWMSLLALHVTVKVSEQDGGGITPYLENTCSSFLYYDSTYHYVIIIRKIFYQKKVPHNYMYQ